MGSPNELWKEVFARATAVASAVAEFSREMAFEVRTESQEAVRTGFGVPRAITSVASFGCFAVAAAGTASITMDLAKKVYGARECQGCSGWEALTCSACRGTGQSGAEEGRCAPCAGTGVQKCATCNGNAWKAKLTLDRVLDSPVVAWDSYRQCKPVAGDVHQQAIMELVQHSVASLAVPPRPAQWGTQSLGLEEEVRQAAVPAATGRGQGVAFDKEETLRKARAVECAVLDAAWAHEWRSQQVSEILTEMNKDLSRVRKQTKQPARPVAPEPQPQAQAQAPSPQKQGLAPKAARPK